MANVTNYTARVLAKAASNMTNSTNMTEQAAAVTAHSKNWIIAFFTVAIPSIASRFWDLISAPFLHSHMQWILLPLLLTFVLAEFYFFRHTEEELGWNAALMNSLVLIFVAIDLIKTVFPGETPWQVTRQFGSALVTGEQISMFLVIIFIGGLGIALAVINYFHLLPRKLAYIISSHPPVNFIAFFAIVLVYSAKAGDPIPLDFYTVLAGTLLFTLIVACIFTAQQLLGTKNTSYYSRA